MILCKFSPESDVDVRVKGQRWIIRWIPPFISVLPLASPGYYKERFQTAQAAYDRLAVIGMVCEIPDYVFTQLEEEFRCV